MSILGRWQMSLTDYRHGAAHGFVAITCCSELLFVWNGRCFRHGRHPKSFDWYVDRCYIKIHILHQWWVHTFIIYWCACVCSCCISGIFVVAWSHPPEIHAPLISQECSRSIPVRGPSNVQVRCPSMMSRMIQEYKKEWILNMLHNSQEYKRTIRNTKKYQWDTKNI